MELEGVTAIVIDHCRTHLDVLLLMVNGHANSPPKDTLTTAVDFDRPAVAAVNHRLLCRRTRGREKSETKRQHQSISYPID